MLDTLKFRRQKLGANIKDNSLLILFSGDAPVRSGDQFYEYTPHRNFYYLTNLDRPKMAYVLRKFNGVMEDYLFIETVSEVEEKWTGKRMSTEEATEISGIKNVFPESELRNMLGRWLLNEGFENAYFDFERGSYHHSDTIQTLFAKELKRQYPFLHVQNIYHDITALRLIKSEDEIANMRTAMEKTR